MRYFSEEIYTTTSTHQAFVHGQGRLGRKNVLSQNQFKKLTWPRLHAPQTLLDDQNRRIRLLDAWGRTPTHDQEHKRAGYDFTSRILRLRWQLRHLC